MVDYFTIHHADAAARAYHPGVGRDLAIGILPPADV